MEKIIKNIEVWCSGKKHKISVTQKGKQKSLVFADHDSFDAESAYGAVGGQICRCYEIQKAWKSYDWNKLPSSLCGLIEQNYLHKITLKISELESKYLYTGQWNKAYEKIKELNALGEKAQDNIGLQIQTHEAMLKSLRRCWYHQGAFVKQVDVSLSDVSESISTTAESHDIEISVNNGYQCEFVIRNLPKSWYDDIYDKGIAILDRHLVIDVIAIVPTLTAYVLRWRKDVGYTIEKAQDVDDKIVWL